MIKIIYISYLGKGIYMSFWHTMLILAFIIFLYVGKQKGIPNKCSIGESLALILKLFIFHLFLCSK